MSTLVNEAQAAEMAARHADGLYTESGNADDVPCLLADRAERVRLAQEAAAREAALAWRLCEASANARILAHSYEHDSRPPLNVVRESLAYAVDQRASMADPSPAAAALLRVVEAARRFSVDRARPVELELREALVELDAAQGAR